MSKYKLVYYLDGIKKCIDLSKIDSLKNKDVTDLKTIDKFTMQFESNNELLLYLKENKLVENSVFKVYIAKEIKDKNTKKSIYEKIYNGEYLLYSSDSKFVNLSFISSYFRQNYRNGNLIRELMDKYCNKYKNVHSTHIVNVLFTLKRIATIIEKNGYDILTVSDKEEYNDCIDDFIILEFCKYEYEYFTRGFIKKYDSNRNPILNQKNIRDFIIYLKNTNKIKQDKLISEEEKTNMKVNLTENIKKEEKVTIYQEHEEFLTEEDFKISNEEILNTYKYNKDDIVEEGHDIIRPLTKTELRTELNNIAKKLVRR